MFVLSLKDHCIVLPRIGWVPNYWEMSTAWRSAQAAEAAAAGSQEADAEAGVGLLLEDGLANDPDIAAETLSSRSRTQHSGRSPHFSPSVPHSAAPSGPPAETVLESPGDALSPITGESPNLDVSAPSPTLASPPPGRPYSSVSRRGHGPYGQG